MTSPSMSDLANALRGDDCPAPEVFLAQNWADLDTATRLQMQTHVATCAACQAERNLASAFDDDSSSARVRAIADRVQLPVAETVPSQFGAWRGLLAATVAACAIGLGAIVVRDDGALPELPQRNSAADTVRGARIQQLPQPAASSPDAMMIRWTPVDDTAHYVVAVRNAAGELVWTAQTGQTAIALPDDLARTGGTLRWDVVAIGAGGERLAQSKEGVYIYGRGGEM
ncbi:MAG: hypothetical protein AB8G17_20260 [Gammaproteobacteria bacterium]